MAINDGRNPTSFGAQASLLVAVCIGTSDQLHRPLSTQIRSRVPVACGLLRSRQCEHSMEYIKDCAHVPIWNLGLFFVSLEVYTF